MKLPRSSIGLQQPMIDDDDDDDNNDGSADDDNNYHNVTHTTGLFLIPLFRCLDTNKTFCKLTVLSKYHNNQNDDTNNQRPTSTSATSYAPAVRACQTAGSLLESRASSDAPR